MMESLKQVLLRCDTEDSGDSNFTEKGQTMGFNILGTGSCLPKKVVSNDDLALIMETSDEWISSRTGIRKRHIAVDETTTSLSAEAAKKAMEMAGVSAEEIDLIIVGTVSADNHYPSTACSVQAEIGAKNATAFDVNAACSGFLFGLQIANGYFASGMANKALIIGAEVLSKMMDWSDRGTCVLFGDGAGAAIIEKSDKAVEFVSGSDGTGGVSLSCKNRPVNNPYKKEEAPLDYTYMDGQAVFKFAVRTVPKAISEALEKSGNVADDIDVYLLHQANLRIIESVAKRLSQPLDKFPTTLEECGNISAASVPILLDKAVRDGIVKREDKIVMAGFGAGLTWGALVTKF